MISEDMKKRIDNISDEFEKRGYFIKEDISELFDSKPDLAQKIMDTKMKRFVFFDDKEENSIGFTLDDVQVEFFITIGEDDEGPWYEACAEVRYF